MPIYGRIESESRNLVSITKQPQNWFVLPVDFKAHLAQKKVHCVLRSTSVSNSRNHWKCKFSSGEETYTKPRKIQPVPFRKRVLRPKRNMSWAKKSRKETSKWNQKRRSLHKNYFCKHDRFAKHVISVSRRLVWAEHVLLHSVEGENWDDICIWKRAFDK